MGFGGSIFLIALGAIFAFAVEFDLGWIDIRVVGWVLMLAGLVGLVTTIWFWQSRRRPVAPAEGQVVAPPHPATAPPHTHVAPPVAAPAEDRVVEEQYRVRRQQL